MEKYGRCPCDDCWLSQGYKSSHKANDLGFLDKYGANRPVRAWKSGTVVAAGQITETINGKKYYPTVVVLMHEDVDCVWITRYWHLVKGSCKVKVGDTVTQGQTIGTRGNTGLSHGVHLHFEIWKCPLGYKYKASDYGKYTVDPMKHTYLFEGQVMKGSPIYPAIPIEKPNPLERDTAVHQVEVIADSLRIRQTPSLKGTQLFIASKGIYNVSQAKEADGYVWYEIDTDCWIATNEGSWTIDYPIVGEETDDLSKEIEDLNKELELYKKALETTENTLKDAIKVIEDVRGAIV